MAVLTVNQAPPASADHTSTRDVWSATLTAGRASPDTGFSSTLGLGTLSDNNLTYQGAQYVIGNMGVRDNGRLAIGFTSSPTTLKSSALTLHVGNDQFALADASLSGNVLAWSNSGLSWSAGDTVQLRLTVPHTTLTASVSPDPIVEGSDLWSATLTVKDLDTTAPAPANVGCDDSKAGARCVTSNVLTNNTFEFKGVPYAVKAISYNQRKVAADPNNVFNITTYPERLKLTLNKAIPESLQTCLTLHAGNATIPFADDGVPEAGVDVKLSASNGVANSTITLTEISGNAWGLNWSAGQTVELSLPNVGCLTLTLSEPVTETTSLQMRIGGTADNYIPHPGRGTLGADNRRPGSYGDYNYIRVPTFAAGSTTAYTAIRPVDDCEGEDTETIILDMTMWPGTDKAVHHKFTVSLWDDDPPGAAPCVGGM